MHIVLVEPEIPPNTGNIVRTCAGTGIQLHLVRPLGFSTDDRYLKRAGLDYWHLANIQYHDSFEELRAAYPDGRFWYSETTAKQNYADVSYHPDDFLVFGKETKGLPESLLNANKEWCIRIPMKEGARSFNLSNSVAIVAFEALRQIGFPDLR